MRKRGQHGKPEIVVFQGLQYRRYPKSPNRSLRVYYSRRGGVHLHREIWKSVHGPIPDKYHIHHVDENPLNNDISNLECVPAGEHISHHHAGKPVTEKQAEHLERIRSMAAEWHKSDEGRAWHSQHAKEIFADRKPAVYKCEYCGKEYESKSRGRMRFCHLNCKASARRKSGIDNIKRACVLCGDEFVINKYATKKKCFPVCRVR